MSLTLYMLRYFFFTLSFLLVFDYGGLDGGNLKEVLDLIVKYEYKSTASTTENVGESALEEGAGTFCLGDCGPAVHGALVQNFRLGTSRLHHHTPTYCVEWIGYNTSDGGYNL